MTEPDAYYEEEDRIGGATVLEDGLIECGVRPGPVREPKEELEALTGAEARAVEAHVRMARRTAAEREELDGEDAGKDEDVMEAYRRKRLAELRARAAAAKFGALADVEPVDFDREVREASAEAAVVVLLHLPGPPAHAASLRMSQIVAALARKFPAVKFCRMAATAAIRNFPPEDAPAVMAYRQGRVVAQFSRLEGFAGAATDADVVEWDLSQKGLLDTELNEDPRLRPGFGRMNVRRPGAAARGRPPVLDDSDDDSDW